MLWVPNPRCGTKHIGDGNTKNSTSRLSPHGQTHLILDRAQHFTFPYKPSEEFLSLQLYVGERGNRATPCTNRQLLEVARTPHIHQLKGFISVFKSSDWFNLVGTGGTSSTRAPLGRRMTHGRGRLGGVVCSEGHLDARPRPEPHRVRSILPSLRGRA